MKTYEQLKTSYLIVGAGISGLVLGIRLRKMGLDAQIIERHGKQLRTICGEYLSPEGVDFLKSNDLTHVLNGFSPVEGMCLFSPKGEKVLTAFPGGKHGVAVNRQVFQERLLCEFESVGGKIHFDNALESISMDENFVDVTTNKLKVRADYIIGADGRQSKVAKLLGLDLGPALHRKLAIHCYLKPKKPLAPFGQMHILPNGSYIGINPISSEEVNFSIVADQEAVKEAGGPRELINFWLQTPALFEQFNLLTDEEIKTTSPITRNSIEITKKRAVLIGDASGFIDPLTGEGMTSAIKTACFLADEINKAANPELAFKKYAIKRRRSFAQKEKLNLTFQKIIASKFLTESIALFLNSSENIKNTFIAVVGNIYRPAQAVNILCKLYLNKRY